ncbi:MAG: lysophospholipid acyltransferase family protein [Vicinamibacterales bacterium]
MPTQAADKRAGGFGLRARYRAEAAAVGALSLVARASPAVIRSAVASALGTFQWAVDARHRRVARDNVRLAYGDALAPREARRIALGSMRHLARLAIETLAAERCLAREADARVRVEGLEHLRAAHARGRGVIGFTGHLGNWELMFLMFGRLGIPVAGIVRPLDNPYLEARLTRLRTMTGNAVIDKRRASREALTRLRTGGYLCILIDQRPKRGGMVVPFFGHDAYTTDALARLALASSAVVIPGFTVREADGSWRMVLEPEVPVERTGDAEADAYRITADCTAIVERWVRRYPDQWLWTHRRWAVPTFGVAAAGAKRRGDGR